MRGTQELESKIIRWREKAKYRCKEIESLKKRKKELILSRDSWKRKYVLSKSRNALLEKELRKSENRSVAIDAKKVKPKHHSYSVVVILLCIWLRQQGNCSLRCCSKMLGIMSFVLELELNFPCANTIQNWEKKLGHYRLGHEYESKGNWIIILDESIVMGEQKLLLVLGVNMDGYKFGKPLCFSQVSVLDMGISKTWKGEGISIRLEALKEKGFNFEYGVSDGGKNLLKALRMNGIYRIPDCTHAIGNLLKNQYAKNKGFMDFIGHCALLRRDVYMGRNTAIIPPKQRKKGRFLNLSPLSSWAYKMLLLLGSKESGLTDSQREKLLWLEGYRKLIHEMKKHCEAMNRIFQILKTDGLDKVTSQKCKVVLEEHGCSPFFSTGVNQYLDDSLGIIEKNHPLVCCSDIIESVFGKYKNLLGNSTQKMINDNCLAIPNFNQDFEIEEIKAAMEKIKIVDLLKWKNGNSPSNLITEKRHLFKNTG